MISGRPDCRVCDGEGRNPEDKDRACSYCQGSGFGDAPSQSLSSTTRRLGHWTLFADVGPLVAQKDCVEIFIDDLWRLDASGAPPTGCAIPRPVLRALIEDAQKRGVW